MYCPAASTDLEELVEPKPGRSGLSLGWGVEMGKAWGSGSSSSSSSGGSKGQQQIAGQRLKPEVGCRVVAVRFQTSGEGWERITSLCGEG